LGAGTLETLKERIPYCSEGTAAQIAVPPLHDGALAHLVTLETVEKTAEQEG